jgi:DNA helicase HerA-like ATPase
MTEISLTNQDRILILGESGGGKTYLVRSFLKKFSKRRVLVITPQADEFTDYPNRIVTLRPEPVMDAIGEALDKGNQIVLIDDSDILLEKSVKDERFKLFLGGARHRGVGWVIISRRTADIPTLVPKQANKLFLFQTDLPRDIEFLNEYYYPAGDEVKALDRDAHEFLYIDRDAKTRTVMTA